MVYKVKPSETFQVASLDIGLAREKKNYSADQTAFMRRPVFADVKVKYSRDETHVII